MEVKLVCVGGKRPGQEIPVRGPEYLIGRSDECHLRPGSPEVSRRHAAVLIQDGLVTIRDFNSSNGTFVNGEQVRGDRELKSGDRLRIGPLEFEVELTVGVGGRKRPKVASVREAAARSATPVGPRNDDDVDLRAWFDEEEEEDAPPQGPKTDTQAGMPGDSTAIIAENKRSAPQKTERKEGAFTLPPHAPGRPAPKSGTSENAAADVLRKLMGH